MWYSGIKMLNKWDDDEIRDQNVKQVAMMKYPLVQWLVVHENMDSKVQQIIEME